MSKKQKQPNFLINETSPYLLQHAKNPVQWYPWGNDAFEKAKTEDKPIFLSIGYSTCHWCHVMAKESFEDDEVAKILNDAFVCIKVDREERPDVDSIYMTVCQAFTGSGGWPLSIFMTASQVPFYAATYLPKKSGSYGIGLLDLLPRLTQIWNKYPQKITESCREIQAHLKAMEESTNPGLPEEAALKKAVKIFSGQFDPEYGGFFSPPKFPSPHNLIFLLHYGILKQDSHCLFMAEKTLEGMYRGGLFDHIGGGFSRYSTDSQWLIPHFEKMLYDNALLSYTYLEAYQLTKRELYKEVAIRTIDYVFKDLTDMEGGFYCGQDADSEGKEGLFYTFTEKETQDVLGYIEGKSFNRWYGITREGNFEGENVINLLNNAQFESFPDWLLPCHHALYYYRLSRHRLHLDNKILTSWNALMIAALAKAYQVLGTTHHLEEGKKTLEFIQTHLIDEDGRIYASYCDGQRKNPGYLDDYSFLCHGLLEMYQADFNPDYLARAIIVAEDMIELFYDPEQGGFYLYGKDGEQLITRPKEVYDGAMPSGNAIAFLNLIRLFHMTGDIKWKEYMDQQATYLAGFTNQSPASHTMSLLSMMGYLYPYKQLIIATKDNDRGKDILEKLNHSLLVNTCIQVKSPDTAEMLKTLAPFTAEYPISKQDYFYVCEGHSCKRPVTSAMEAMELLQAFLP